MSKAGRYNTRARVRVVLEVETGSDAWTGDEPSYRRAFREAKDRAFNIINTAFGKMRSELRREFPIQLQGIEVIELVVVEATEPSTAEGEGS